MFFIELIKFIDLDRPGWQGRVPDRDLVHAHAGKALDHIRHLPVYDTDQDDDGGHAYDKSQHIQEGTHIVPPNAPESHFK